ncbi:hypothetical protein Wildcat_66 [Mycobacterium phage Wildcat]|uniref:Uncharacterized protein n=4 Tax=Mycobacterium virus Wildcat TaxID=1993859 RepID=Q19XZ4_9CAUD|nr:hypothetical protein Wildcat_66 [Mycobacterium phage Wildcat]AJD82139.1 hypothetical protein COSMO_67 [Mycobacterium phage Cosmo]AQT25736.1 hypothetical protein EniyanLRS_62 [Mycobacterium phage EniyanLRS]QGJ89954.1 hypothetical protein PBI_MARYV_66 [Mycobacterium phage MaryV]WKR36077.1 hypothetical protein [Mycobacterium phage Azrael100]ABE67671.1 hypothetical protein Wildcat_66 [Mycobacterium phage Wildcat]
MLYLLGLLGLHRVKIVYKSGHVEKFFAHEFEWKRNGSNVSATWKSVALCKRPMDLHLDEIESVWQLW